jgi:hypothetical protein
MAPKRAAVLLVFLAILVLAGAGCAPSEPEGEGVPLVTAIPGPTMTPVTPLTSSAEAEPPTQRAKEDLAQRLGISPDEITMVSVEEVTWPDSSLGCPQPGRVYLQVITPGYRIILRAGSHEYAYHTDRGQQVILCTKDREPEPVATVEGEVLPRTSPTVERPFFPGTPVPPDQVSEAINLAVTDLAGRLRVSPKEILVVAVRGWTWWDTNLGYPARDASRTSVATPGYVVVLFAQGQEHEYHADRKGRLVYCPGGPWTSHPRLRPTPGHPPRSR